MKIYTHRNGETEPPTVEGKYWFRGSIGDVDLDAGITTVALDKTGRLMAWDFHFDMQQYMTEFAGQWWGPLVAPWETAA